VRLCVYAFVRVFACVCPAVDDDGQDDWTSNNNDDGDGDSNGDGDDGGGGGDGDGGGGGATATGSGAAGSGGGNASTTTDRSVVGKGGVYCAKDCFRVWIGDGFCDNGTVLQYNTPFVFVLFLYEGAELIVCRRESGFHQAVRKQDSTGMKTFCCCLQLMRVRV
jgi:hypothetical protein